MSKYVMSAAEVDELAHRKGWPTHTTYDVESVSLEFTTTQEFVRSVLPPCFDPTERPDGLVSVASWRREDGPGRMAEFDGTCVFVRAAFEGVEGWYSLTMVINGDMPVTLGREGFGEIKKTGSSRFYFNGCGVYAYGERHGVRIVEMTAQLGPDEGPSHHDSLSLELKAQPTPDYRDFQSDPAVVRMRSIDSAVVTRTGTGSLTFRDNGRDPVTSIPVADTGQCTYTAGTSEFSVHEWKALSGIEYSELAPFVLGRQYDFHRS